MSMMDRNGKLFTILVLLNSLTIVAIWCCVFPFCILTLIMIPPVLNSVIICSIVLSLNINQYLLKIIWLLIYINTTPFCTVCMNIETFICKLKGRTLIAYFGTFEGYGFTSVQYMPLLRMFAIFFMW